MQDSLHRRNFLKTAGVALGSGAAGFLDQEPTEAFEFFRGMHRRHLGRCQRTHITEHINQRLEAVRKEQCGKIVDVHLSLDPRAVNGFVWYPSAHFHEDYKKWNMAECIEQSQRELYDVLLAHRKSPVRTDTAA